MANASLHWGLVQAVATTLKGMVPARLPGITAASIIPRKVPAFLDFSSKSPIPADKNFAFPGIVVCFWDKEIISNFSNITDEYGYPVLVVFAVKQANPDPQPSGDPGGDQYLGWRQQVESILLHGQYSITDPVATFYDVDCEPGPIIDWTKWQGEGIVAGSLGFRFKIQSGRG